MASSSSSSSVPPPGLKKKKQIKSFPGHFIPMVGAVLPRGVQITDSLGVVATKWVLLEAQSVYLDFQQFTLYLGYNETPQRIAHMTILNEDMIDDVENFYRFLVLTSSGTPTLFGVELRVPTAAAGGGGGGVGGPPTFDVWTFLFDLARETEVRGAFDQLKVRLKSLNWTNLAFEGCDDTPSPPDDEGNNNGGGGGGRGVSSADASSGTG